jgi:hypothetical protein
MNHLRTKSHAVDGPKMQNQSNKNYMSNIQKMRNLELESREIDSKMAQLRQNQNNENVFSHNYSNNKENVSHHNSNNSNSFINNLNLKMLSITSNRKVNPQRMKLQNQASMSSLTECSYN